MSGEFWAQWGAGITGATLLMVAALLAVIAWFQGRGARAARQWQSAPGEILDSTVESYLHHSSDDSTMTAYRAKIIYGYRVGGKEYVGERLNFGGGIHSSIRALAENKARQFPPGAAVQVFYDPQNPNEATLERDAPAARLLYIIAGILALIALIACASGFGMMQWFAA